MSDWCSAKVGPRTVTNGSGSTSAAWLNEGYLG